MSGLLLGIRFNLNEFRRLHVEEVDFDSKIEKFKDYVSEKTNIQKDSLELVYCGNILDDDLTLTACGLKPGVMLHVLKKKPKEVPIPTQPMSEQDIKALVIAFRTLTLNPSHRHSLQKLSRPEILENIIMITPGLSQDPVAISLIQDPELIVRLSANFDTVRRIVELHPALAEAANHIAATVHEEAIHSQPIPGPSTSAGFNLLDLLSDEEEMESSQSSDSVQPGVSRQPSFSAITPAQLAAAIASASQGGAGGGSANRATDASGSTITPEMVSEAMQRAMASVAPSSSFSSSSQQEEGSNNSSDLREQMRQMRELGLTDDALNLQALQLAGGNVHAAVDLVFSGAIGADPNM